VKGGEIKGRMTAESRRRTHPFDRFVRTAVKAKRKPRMVPQRPTSGSSAIPGDASRRE